MVDAEGEEGRVGDEVGGGRVCAGGVVPCGFCDGREESADKPEHGEGTVGAAARGGDEVVGQERRTVGAGTVCREQNMN